MVWNRGQSLFGGRYVIEGKLGEGGIGITYLVRNQTNELRVIKTLKEEILNNCSWKVQRDKLRQDFRSEAVRLAVCRHPHIVQIENIFDEYDLPCMVMEYIEGEDLGKRLRQRGILSESEALLYIRQIGDALTVIHQKGLLHRDIKPRNIIIRTGRREAVLIDFGIAREFIPGVVQRHTVYRTPGFAPPEQYQLEAPRGEYIDVYGLAATLYTLLTGVVPTSADERNRNAPLLPPHHFNPGISHSVDRAIMQAMAMQPQYRPQSVKEWLSLLSNLENIRGIHISPPSTAKLSQSIITPQLTWQCVRTIEARGMVYAVTISPNGKFFASASSDNSIKLWNLDTGKNIRNFGRLFLGHTDSVWTLAISPNGEILASGGWDNTIKLWFLNTGKNIRTLYTHTNWVNSLAFSPDGKLLASGSADCSVQLILVSTGNVINTFFGHTDTVTSVAFSPDGQLLASAGADFSIKLWQVSTGCEIRTLVGHSFFVNCVAFDREGNTLVSGSSDKTIRFWHAITGRMLKTLTGHTDAVSSIALSPDMQILASGSWDSTIKLWHIDTATEICTLSGHNNYIRSIAFSPDSKTLVSASDDDTIKIWRHKDD
ncbi:MAG: serine/threonine protein kinase [Calothrix sp. C42_A2020_038]|nr:serine/threonine protein kinase [Calothrix sp. C42_A2020_038]